MNLKNSRILQPIKKARREALLSWLNFRGWSTDQKYIIFESDDWGGIRTASPDAYQAMIKAGDPLDKYPFPRYDALASEDDLELLFELLYGFTDIHGNHPVFTANTTVANPDFEKIRESKFSAYYYEPFTETLKKYANHGRCFELWKSGMTNGIFHPQLHCREHVHITRWLQDLQKGDKDLHRAFEHDMISGGSSFDENNRFAYMDAFNYYGLEYDALLESIISDAANLFASIFGYKSRSFVPSCYVWNSRLESILAMHDIEFIQGRYQLIPTERGYGQFDEKKHIIGEKNDNNQRYLVRNCTFEPSLGYGSAAVDLCLAEISNAFRWKKPATIGTHRVNYVGYIDRSNRDHNLPLLQQLLTQIMACWPDVQFITSDALGTILAGSELN